MSIANDKVVWQKAVILVNLGGAESVGVALHRFLYSIFADPRIIRLPAVIRQSLAFLIASLRYFAARKIYRQVGGQSPILSITESQAEAVEVMLNGLHDVPVYRVFVAMRYSSPRLEKVLSEIVRDQQINKIIVLPLYPQFSTTTTLSAFELLDHCIKDASLNRKTVVKTCCFYDHPKIISYYAQAIQVLYAKASAVGGVRVLFSAHGLPQSIVDEGDPYALQVERMAAKIVQALSIEGLDWCLGYQSRVGYAKWLSPYLRDEIARAGLAQKVLIIVPLSFVSENTETLVELDEDYRIFAKEKGVMAYFRVPTPGTAEGLISILAEMVKQADQRQEAVCCGSTAACLCRQFFDGAVKDHANEEVE